MVIRCCAGTGAIVNIHNALFADVIDKYGTSDQKRKFFPGFVNGENVGSFALSEPGFNIIVITYYQKESFVIGPLFFTK